MNQKYKLYCAECGRVIIPGTGMNCHHLEVKTATPRMTNEDILSELQGIVEKKRCDCTTCQRYVEKGINKLIKKIKNDCLLESEHESID